MSLYNFTVNYTSSVKCAAVTAWQATHGYTAAQIARRVTLNATQGNLFMCTTAGTSSGTEPTWPGNRGQQVTDGTVHWTEMTGQPAFNGDAVNTARWSSVNHVGVDVGNVIKDVSNNAFICITSGTSGTSEPSWNTGSLGATTTDGGVTWMYCGAISSFSNWANPHPLLSNALRTGWGYGGAGTNPTLQQAYVAHNHAGAPTGNEIGGNTTVTNGATDIICVNSAGSIPPVTADLATTATETATSNNHGIFGCLRFVYGLNIIVAGSSNNALTINDDNNDILYKNCTFKLTTTGSSAAFAITSGGTTRCEDCTFVFGNAGQSFHGAGRLEVIGGTVAATGTVPTDLIQQTSTGQLYLFQGVDLSACTSIVLVGGNPNNACQYDFVDCKMPSSYTVDGITNETTRSLNVSVVRCSASGNIDQLQTAGYGGNISSDATVVRTGGASGANPFSLKMVSNANVNSGADPLISPSIIQPNTTTGSDVNVTVFGIVNAAALLTEFDVWLEVHYLGTSGNTVSTHLSSHPEDYLLSTSLISTLADTSAWDTKATARANTHAYSTGDVIAVASNPNRVFFCTASGTSAGSEPGGYATAIDGGSVTDSGATFRAGCRFKIELSLAHPAPAIAANFTAFVRLGKPSTTLYFDPLLTLS